MLAVARRMAGDGLERLAEDDGRCEDTEQAATVGGEEGVLHAITLMKAEILRSMALLGCVDFSALPSRARPPL